MAHCEIIAEGYGAFDGVRMWEERHTLDICHKDDAEQMAELHALSLQDRYQCALRRRGKTSWLLSEPGELQLWVRMRTIWEE